jgi:hypothetical protein
MESCPLRDEELALIKTAAKDENSRAFEILLTAFDLSQQYRDILAGELSKGGWENARNPLSALRRSVLAAAFGRKRASSRGVPDALGLSVKGIGAMRYRADTLEAVPGQDNVWRQGRGLNPESDDRLSYYRTDDDMRGPLIKRVRSEFIRIVEPKKHLSRRDQRSIIDPFPIVDWNAVIQRAGLDELETVILLSYITRNRGRAECMADYAEDSADRKAIEAAVKRVKRKLNKIKEILFES